MRFHLHSLKGKATESGRRITWQDIADGTGIRKPTLLNIANGRSRTIRPEYIDALCAYFEVPVGDLLSADEIDLPLELNLRPDRRGKRFGER